MASAPGENPVSSQQLQSRIQEIRLRLGKQNTSRKIASSTSPVHPSYPDSLNYIQTPGRTPILELPDELLLMIDRHLDKQALLSLLRVCRSLHKLLGKCKIFTAWEWLANDPLAEGTMELLEQLEARDSQFVLAKGFRRYKPGTDQRKALKTFMQDRQNINQLCTTLLKAELDKRRTEDAEFLCGLGAYRGYLNDYKRFENRGEEKYRQQRRQQRLKLRLEST